MVIDNNTSISDDKSKLNIAVIHNFITQALWAKGRTIEEVKRTIDESLCFGMYLGVQQIGFARVLSDGVAFAYLLDVFILQPYRGSGFSKYLISTILQHPSLRNVSKWMLSSSDAQGLYKKFGFKEIAKPEELMERTNVKS